MTTENVVVLFADMVGSTELSSSLSAEAADELRRSHFSILRQAIAEAAGTEVKNLGDGVMVMFGSASADPVPAVMPAPETLWALPRASFADQIITGHATLANRPVASLAVVEGGIVQADDRTRAIASGDSWLASAVVRTRWAISRRP